MRKRKEGLVNSYEDIVPKLPVKVSTSDFSIPSSLKLKKWDSAVSGSPYFFDDYQLNEEIHHLDGQTIEEAEHQMTTRLIDFRLHFPYSAPDPYP